MVRLAGKVRIVTPIAAFILFALLAGCGSSVQLVQMANAFLGGALSNFGGLDGDDPDARNTAREIATSRVYDFTQAGFVLADGPVSTVNSNPGSFAQGTGTITLTADNATVGIDIDSSDPAVTGVQMEGTFSAGQAQSTIDSPGASFTVEWAIAWTQDGQDYSLSAEQTLSGTDWIEQ